ncbi:MAG: 6-phosphogluconolactonase [Acidobacteria bacterium]|nr:6-phosphogluconolactonase [Acidobacteriota bacterium]
MTLPPGARLTAAGETVVVAGSTVALARRAAAFLDDRIATAVTRDGQAVLALSGGITPEMTYRCLAGYRPDAASLALLQVDERLVAAGDPRSNGAMIRRAWGGRPPLLPMIPDVRGDAHTSPENPLPPAGRLAAAYAHTLDRVAPARSLGVPVVHLCILGLGMDGHTASLFPGSPALAERCRWVVPVDGPTTPAGGSPEVARLTLTLPVLDAARCLVFLVQGEAKAGVVRQVLQGNGCRLPVARLARRTRRAVWFLDTAAAAGLSL